MTKPAKKRSYREYAKRALSGIGQFLIGDNGGYGRHIRVRPNGSRYIEDVDGYFRNNEEWKEKVAKISGHFGGKARTAKNSGAQ